MRVSGAVAAVLFLAPTIYFVKYAAFDAPREQALITAYESAQNGAATLGSAESFDRQRAWLTVHDPDRIPLLVNAATQDPDPALRGQAVTTLGELLLKPGVSIRRPIEALQGKAALAGAAAHDSDPGVQAAARTAIDAVAAGGAVLRR